MKDGTPLAKAALNYARNGWFVFPIKPRDKTPMTPNGFKNASNNPETVRAWWAKTPDANIGLDCGRSGLVVVDLDKRGEEDGVSEWQALAAGYGDTPTATSLTGGGGKHLLFKKPEGVTIRNSAGRLAKHIDVRGDGGYIVLPPSIHPTGPDYRWQDERTALAPLPEFVMHLLASDPDPWKIFTLRDAFQPRPPLTWLVDRILPTGSLSIWYGAPGTLKSMILADLSVCVAGGLRWLTNTQGAGGYRTEQSPVLWLDFDNGARRTHERFHALAHAHGLPDNAPLYYVSMPEPQLDAGDTELMGQLAARILSRGVSLVVIDNLGVVSGSADENTAEMQKPMGGLRWLSEATGAAVAVLHHQRKSNGFNSRSGDTLRGHGSIEAKIDLGVLVARDGFNITLTPTKVRGIDFKPFSATFGHDNDDHHELTSARFWPLEGASDAQVQGKEDQAIIAYIRRFPNSTATQVYKQIGGKKQRILDALRRLEAAGQIIKSGPEGHSLLTVP